MRISLIISLLAVLAVVAGCGSGGGGDRTPPSITNVLIAPTRVDLSGTVVVTADATDETQLQSVTAVATGPSTLSQPMTAQPGTASFAGSIALPNNNTGNDQVYQVKVVAKDSSNNTAESVSVAVTVRGIENPPPPPASAPK